MSSFISLCLQSRLALCLDALFPTSFLLTLVCISVQWSASDGPSEESYLTRGDIFILNKGQPLVQRMMQTKHIHTRTHHMKCIQLYFVRQENKLFVFFPYSSIIQKRTEVWTSGPESTFQHRTQRVTLSIKGTKTHRKVTTYTCGFRMIPDRHFNRWSQQEVTFRERARDVAKWSCILLQSSKQKLYLHHYLPRSKVSEKHKKRSDKRRLHAKSLVLITLFLKFTRRPKTCSEQQLK